MNKQPIDHILGVLGKPDVTAVAAGRAAHRQAQTVRVGAVILIVGRDWPVRSQRRGGRYRLQGETVVPQTALMPLGTGRDSSGRLNFAAHSPG